MSYFDLLPEELIVEIFHQLYDPEDISNFSCLYSGVYLKYKNCITKQLLINNYPQMEDVINEHPVTYFESFDINKFDEINRRGDIFSEDDASMICLLLLIEYKDSPLYINLLVRYVFSKSFKIIYNKIKHFFITHKYLLKAFLVLSLFQSYKEYFSKGVLPDNYIHICYDTNYILEASDIDGSIIDWLILQEPNFNLEIQDKNILNKMISNIKSIDVELYNRLSKVTI